MVQRVLRFLGYLAIGLVIAALIAVAAVYTPRSIQKKMSGGWMGLIFYTPIVFGYAARQYRRLWHRLSFWVTLSGLLILHVLAFTLVLRNYSVWPFWFAVIAGVEVALITIVLDMVLPSPHQNHRHDATHV